jgi:hypothetical protein
MTDREHLIYLSEKIAKVLYAVLRLQHDQRHELPGATVKRVESFTGFKDKAVRESLEELQKAGYVSAAVAKGEARQLMENAQDIYEIDVRTSITCRDTAVFLLALVEAWKSSKDPEGKVDARPLVEKLVKEKQFKYLTEVDIFGNHLGYKGKIAELIEAGMHLERVSEKHFRLRAKVHMEERYLQVLKAQPTLDELAAWTFPISPRTKSVPPETP